MNRASKYMTVGDIASALSLSAQTVRRIARCRCIAHDATIGGRRAWRAKRVAEFAPGPPGWWRKRR